MKNRNVFALVAEKRENQGDLDYGRRSTVKKKRKVNSFDLAGRVRKGGELVKLTKANSIIFFNRPKGGKRRGKRRKWDWENKNLSNNTKERKMGESLRMKRHSR